MNQWSTLPQTLHSRRSQRIPQEDAVSTPDTQEEATTKRTQHQQRGPPPFVNDATIPNEAVYLFQVPARAAVCQFIIVKQDGTRVQGLIQEKSEAQETYDAALAELTNVHPMLYL